MIKKSKRIKIIEEFKKNTNNAPDINYKDFEFNDEAITFIYSMSVSSSNDINDFILRRIDEDKDKIKSDDLYEYIKNYIPNNNILSFNQEKEISYYVMSGFTVCVFDDGKLLAFENRANIYSPINKSENEKGIKGPSDAFSENYQFNMGMIRRRIKTEKLWIDEATVGSESKTKVALFYIKGVSNEQMVKKISKQINNINIKYVGNTNYIIDAISNTNRFIFPTTLATQRPDFACQMLLEGRIVLMVENSNEVIILPCMFIDFFKNPEDYYEKSLNVIGNRIIRIIALFLAILTPAVYISLMAYNQEALPSGLLINFSIQRDGVPFSTVFEIIVMSFMFYILRESDMRFPGKGGSSISIVGALVLGQAAVEAGIVSPITIIIVGISSVASLAFSSIELINSIKWVQLFLIILAALFGFIGVMFGFIMLMALLISQNSCGKPYFSPFEPFNFKAQKDAIITKKSAKFNPDIVYDKDDDDEKNS